MSHHIPDAGKMVSDASRAGADSLGTAMHAEPPHE
jgi:hypothetical protein